MGFEYMATPGGRWNSVPWMSWSPQGDRLAYFVRTEKDRSLIVQNVVTRDRGAHPDDDDRRAGIARLLSGRQADRVLRHARQRRDIFTVNLETKEIVNLTKDQFADYAPTWAPDGRSLVYLVRGQRQREAVPHGCERRQPTQLTFGTHDDSGAQFLDANTLVFASTAVNPAEPIDPDVAKNGQIYNIWTLNLKTNELKQFTDALAGNTRRWCCATRRSTASRSSPTSRANTACTSSSARRRSPRSPRPTSARPGRSSTSRRR